MPPVENHSANGDSKAEMEEDESMLREWLQRQSHLPTEVDSALLRQMLCRCGGSVERAKSRLESFFCLRTAISEVFSKRDPTVPEVQQARKTMMWTPLPKETPQGNTVYVFRLSDQDSANFSLQGILRAAHMEMDELMRKRGGKPKQGIVYVYDLTGFSLAFLARMPFSLVSKVFAYVHEGLYVKIREVHLLSSSSVVDRLVAFLRPLVRRMDKLHIHSMSNLDTLYEHIPKDIMPKEYGGEEETLEKLHKKRCAAVDSIRDWLAEEEKNQRVSEDTLTKWKRGLSWSLSLGENEGNSAFGVDGSFRKLSID
ncbi:alpha-tocopherol transfer protein-like [Ischnura elegans]|uniref:alpha-tocopherol transfer protein-like n=1 Tax=Ischnura elegans TaxID=197161 RepID=UPI001ED877F6|nr:alpha-tocopherol transfer protein-like [Ischnura elegans]